MTSSWSRWSAAATPGAFDIIVDRYQARLLGFCRQMIGSTEDAEDVLQEVFVNAYKAMLADNREINLRPWLYRIARNRSLNHLRKPKADAQESMDMVPMVEAGSTAEKVHNREEFRQLLNDVTKLPETQRAALLLREIDALSYEEIAEAMDTTVPSVKSLLVRARISLAEASQARMLTCGEVRVELAEAAEGLTKASGPVRRHVRDCDECADFRKQLRDDESAGDAHAGRSAARLQGGASRPSSASVDAAGTAGSAGAGTAAGAGSAVGTAAAGAAAAGTTAGAAIGAGSAALGHRRARRRDRRQGRGRSRHRRRDHRRSGRSFQARSQPTGGPGRERRPWPDHRRRSRRGKNAARGIAAPHRSRSTRR